MIFKTKSKTFIFLCTVMCGLSLFFYSCNNPAAFSGDGSISFELPKTDQARLTSGDISFYDISVQSSDGTVVFQNNKFTGGTCTVPNLNSGNYTISIKGYTSDSTRSYLVTQGTNTATVTAGNTSAVSITLKGYAFFINQSDSVFGWAKGDDSNSGNSPSFPLYNLQSAVEKILEKNDGETEYRIYVAGALAPRNKEELNVPSTASSRGVGTAEDSVVMADFTSLKNGNLNVFIEGVGSGAALNGGRTYGGTIIAGNSDTSIPGLNLTLKNLSISNDAEAPSINLNGATLNIEGEITVKNPMTVYGSSETSATKINAVNEDSFIKTEDNTSAVRILTNASLKMNADGKFKLSVSGDDTICSMPFVLIEGGNLEANNCSFSNRKIESSIDAEYAVCALKSLNGSVSLENCVISDCSSYASENLSYMPCSTLIYSNNSEITLNNSKINNENKNADVKVQGLWINDKKSSVTLSGAVSGGETEGKNKPLDIYIAAKFTQEETSSTPLVKLNDFDNKNSTIALTIPNCDSVEGIKIVEKNDNETSNITAIVGYEETEYVIGDGEDAPLVNPSIFDRDLLEAELLKTGQTLDTVASFTVPSNYKIIADETFKELTNLKTVVLLSGLTEIRSYAFTDCEKLSSVNIPDTVVNIGQSAFQNCTSLTSVSIPGSIVNLSDNIFSGCSALANVTLSEGISTLGYASFAQCTSLTGITLPESLAAINNSAFSGSGLTEVTIPSDVSSIMGWAFSNCESLTRVTFTAALASDGYGTSVFDSCNSSLKIYVPSEAESTFKTKWSDYATFIYTAIPISTASEYKAAVAVINSGNYNQNIILTKNIDLSGETESYVICTTFENPYTGTFNGNGKTLTVSKACGTFYPPYENHNGNMNTTSDNTEAFFAGIVGFIGEAGIVENVIVKSNDFDSEVSGIQHLGGIAYGNMGTIRNCENDISFTCSTYGNIGGICTENYGTIVNCINKGDISNNLINLNWAGRWEMAGGIAAGNGVDCDSSEGCGIFTSPANEETVSSLKGSIINCVNLGTVTTKNSDEDNDINGVPGAIAGFNGEGNKISNCYYKKDSVVKGSNTTSYPAYRPTTYTGVIQGTIEYCATMSDTITLFATITAGTESDCGVEQIIYKSKSYLNDALNAYVTDNNSDGKLKSWKKVTTDIGLSY